MYAQGEYKCNNSSHGCIVQGGDLTEATKPDKWVAGMGLPLVWRTKPPGCLILEEYRLSTNKKLEVLTQTGYFLLSLVATFLLSRKFGGKGKFVKKNRPGCCFVLEILPVKILGHFLKGNV